MKTERRSFIATVIAAVLTPAWLKADTIPVRPVGHIPVRPASWGETAKKALSWAEMCIRHGAHWTIGAIRFASASIGQVRHHLVSVHGHSYGELDGMSKEQLGNLHDAHHEGRSYAHYRIPATPANGVDKLMMGGGCPGGNCPIPQSTRRRGLARFFGG